MEICFFVYDQHFSFKCFVYFCYRDIDKIVRRFWALQAAKGLTLPMLRLLLTKAQTSRPCLVGIHWIALTEYSQMSTHVLRFLHNFVLAKLATSSIRVKNGWL